MEAADEEEEEAEKQGPPAAHPGPPPAALHTPDMEEEEEKGDAAKPEKAGAPAPAPTASTTASSSTTRRLPPVAALAREGSAAATDAAASLTAWACSAAVTVALSSPDLRDPAFLLRTAAAADPATVTGLVAVAAVALRSLAGGAMLSAALHCGPGGWLRALSWAAWLTGVRAAREGVALVCWGEEEETSSGAGSAAAPPPPVASSSAPALPAPAKVAVESGRAGQEGVEE